MTKLLALVVLVLAVWLIAKRARSARPAAPFNLLVRCSACGTHVPEGSVRRRGTDVFCSVACEQRAAS